jgi:microcystin-dependent protein
MAEPFLSEIRIFSVDWAPKGWAECNGQFLPINQNQPLFALLGTTFGGNGQTTFALPDLRGRVPIHVGSGHTLGEKAGEQAHTLSIAELPTHIHTLSASTTQGTLNDPTGAVIAKSAQNAYAPAQNFVAMNSAVLAPVGGSQAHQNMQPFIVITFAIALQGLFPSPN